MNRKKPWKVPLAHKDKGEMNKRLLISIITFVLIGLLVLFIFYGKSFVGKAIMPGTATQSGSGSIFIEDGSFVGPGEPLLLPVSVNIGQDALTFRLSFIYDKEKLAFVEFIPSEDIVILEQEEEGGGQVTMVGMISPEVSFRGEKKLLDIKFNSLNAYGETSITFDYLEVLDENNVNQITNLIHEASFDIKIGSEDCYTIGVDEDMDGLMDCEDVDDCGNEPICADTEISGDVDGDGIEDMLDNCPRVPNPNQEEFYCTIEYDCANNIDDDENGFIDCADDYCRGVNCGDEGCTCSNGQATEMNCADASDNDRDGLVDCEDSDCNSFSACEVSPEEVVLGDMNGDGCVNISELMNYISSWKHGEVNITNLMDVISSWKKGCII